MQDEVKSGTIQVMKVRGEGDLADALTKALDGPGVGKHKELTGLVVMEGRRELTPNSEAAEDGGIGDIEEVSGEFGELA